MKINLYISSIQFLNVNNKLIFHIKKFATHRCVRSKYVCIYKYEEEYEEEMLRVIL